VPKRWALSSLAKLDVVGKKGKVRKSSGDSEVIWRPRRDSNPRYRRESGSEPGKLLKSGGMDSAARHFRA
jgi:hypothetical protein